MPRAEFFASLTLMMGARCEADCVVGLLAMRKKEQPPFRHYFPSLLHLCELMEEG